MTCPACDAALAPLWRVGEWSIARCGQCGLGALDPQPAPEMIAALYAAPDYYTAHGGSGMTADDLRDAGPRSSLAKYFRRYRLEPLAAALGRRGPLLDVGCSGGGFLAVARWAGWGPVIGVEPSRIARQAARMTWGVTIVGTGLAHAAVRPGSLDAITLYHVLEHVPDPIATVRQAARLLRRGGVVAVESPNFASLAARLHGPRYRMLLPPYHLWHFTPAALRRVFLRAGLDPVRVFTPYAPQGTALIVDIQAGLLRLRAAAQRRLRGAARRPEPQRPPSQRPDEARSRRRAWVDRAFEALYWLPDQAAALMRLGVNVYGLGRKT